ncbi:MAG: SPFH domain-containing protein, partial [Clostridia bacterium]|nr:SPFH domain-containing protein [Clostridia bacterium]
MSQMWKVVDWKDDSDNTLVYRFQMPKPKWEIMTGSKLTVRESQVAVFVNKGQIADIFTPGQYTLSTGNLPILSGLRSLLYQGREVVVKSDVYFVNTKQFTNQKWGTLNPVIMRDTDFGMVRIKAFGSYAFRVTDAGRFLKELFGTNSTFTTDDITNHLKSLIVSQMSDCIGESKMGILDMAANLQEFSTSINGNLNEKF